MQVQQSANVWWMSTGVSSLRRRKSRPRSCQSGMKLLQGQSKVVSQTCSCVVLLCITEMPLRDLLQLHRLHHCLSGSVTVTACVLRRPQSSGEYKSVDGNGFRMCSCRGRWLLGLLVLQSTSSFVLDSYQELLRVSGNRNLQ